MKRYLITAGIVSTFFLIMFLVVEALNIPLLTDPSPYLNQGSFPAAILGVGLLVADVVLPVPSSLIMIINGALFGVLLGAFLSLTGSVGATLFGFSIGRRGGRLFSRLLSVEERERADNLLKKWGGLAIVITRPIPLLAETVAIMAGASPLKWTTVTIAALVGSLPGAVLYALAGAVAGSFQSEVLVFGLVMLIAGVFWLIGRRAGSGLTEAEETST